MRCAVALLILLPQCLSLLCRTHSRAKYHYAASSNDIFDDFLDSTDSDSDEVNDSDAIIARQESRWSTTKYQTTYSQQPSFFPRTLDELAKDCLDSTQIALISGIKRIRVDVRMRITEKDRHMLKFLISYVYMLLDDEIKSIKVLVSNDLVVKLLDKVCGSDDRVKFVPMNKWSGEAADLYVVHQPGLDAIQGDGGQSYYSNLQILCNHAASMKVPTIFVNPVNMARAYIPLTLDPPILINDFANAYYVCDDYFMVSHGDKYCGLVQRAGLGTDLYLLEGFRDVSPKRYRRLDTYSRQPLPIENIRDRITRSILDDPDSPVVKVFREANRRVYDDDISTGGFAGRQRRSAGSTNIANIIKAFQGKE